jgi:hypothetical protein
MLSALAQRIQNGSNNQKGLFDSVVGQIKTQEKRWIVDIDTKDGRTISEIEATINMCKPEGNKLIASIPTKNGVHLITKRFDVMEFSKKYPEIGIQKKNPTLLYFPNSLEPKD